MSESLNSSLLKYYPLPITKDKNAIITEQMEKCICKIKIENSEGNGFFCKISHNNMKVYLLITNNNILNNNIIIAHKTINIFFDENIEYKTIEINENKNIYTSDQYGITIIQIHPEIDKINFFMELDQMIFNNSFNLSNEAIYILHYYKYNNEIETISSVSYGILKNIEDSNLNFYCNGGTNMLGSPILRLSTNKIIGIYKDKINNDFNYNIGKLLKNPINEFLKNIKVNDNNSILSQQKKNKNINASKIPEIENIILGPEIEDEEKEEKSDLKINKNIKPIVELKYTKLGPENEDKEEEQNIIVQNNNLNKNNNLINPNVIQNSDLKDNKDENIFKNKNNIFNSNSDNNPQSNYNYNKTHYYNSNDNLNINNELGKKSNNSDGKSININNNNNAFNNINDKMNNFNNLGNNLNNNINNNMNINNFNKNKFNSDMNIKNQNYFSNMNMNNKNMNNFNMNNKNMNNFNENINMNNKNMNNFNENINMNNKNINNFSDMNININNKNINNFSDMNINMNNNMNINSNNNNLNNFNKNNNNNWNMNLNNNKNMNNMNLNNNNNMNNMNLNNNNNNLNNLNQMQNNWNNNVNKNINANKTTGNVDKKIGILDNQIIFGLKNNNNLNNNINNNNLNQNNYFSNYKNATKTVLKNIQNFGDTSYLNTVLQLLGSFKGLIKFFLNPVNSINQTNNIILSFYIQRIFIHLYPFPEKEIGEKYEPIYIFQYLNNLKVKQNPNNIIKFILDRIHNELNQYNNYQRKIPNKFNRKNVIDTEIKNYINSNNSVIYNYFNYFEIKESQCCFCNIIEYDFKTYNTLELDILNTFNFMKRNYITIGNCLEFYENIKQMNNFCENCRNQCLKLNSSKIYVSPNIFIFSLDRGNLDINLLNVNFLVEPKINLEKYIEASNIIKEYELIGIVSIYRNEKRYVCCCKSPIDKQWYYYDNEIIQKVDLNTIITNHNNYLFVPCILAYKRIRNN